MRLQTLITTLLSLSLLASLTSCYRFLDDHLYAGSTPARRSNTGNSIHNKEKYEPLLARHASRPVLAESAESGEDVGYTEGIGVTEKPLPYDLVRAPRPHQANRLPAGPKPPEDFWNIDIEVALREAENSQLPLLLYFCGSDWSDDCKKMDKRLFNSRAFSDFATNEVVAVRIDFPRLITHTAAHTAQNKRLKQHYEVQLYPTIVLLQSDGTYIARLGYEDLPPQQFIETFRRLLIMGPVSF